MSYSYKQDLMKRLDDGSLQGLPLGHSFTFECKAACMGRCCNNITILLDPWDIEIMARHLGLPGQQFLGEYCKVDFGHELKWPYARLKHAEDGPCFFMLEDGRCKIYPVRSRNCRTYPIGRAVRFEPDGTKTERTFIVEKMDFCLGHKSEKSWSVEEWFNDADCQKFYQLSDLYLELIHYATTQLNSQAWMNRNISQMMMPLLYGPDLLRSKLGISEQEVDHEEFYRRRLKAIKVILTELAAGFGHGPLAGQAKEGGGFDGSMMERMKQVLVTGKE
ncbi:MAG: YkgJ family cysteine cluster protein [Bacillota bacterium]